jgi:hypothetical protein
MCTFTQCTCLKGSVFELFFFQMYSVLNGAIVLQESGIPQWLSWLPRDGGYRSVQSALWKRLNDYINRYDQYVSVN